MLLLVCSGLFLPVERIHALEFAGSHLGWISLVGTILLFIYIVIGIILCWEHVARECV